MKTLLAKDQRDQWKKEFQDGKPVRSHYLDEHKKMRDNKHWRTTAALEYLCEYIIYLEEKVDESS